MSAILGLISASFDIFKTVRKGLGAIWKSGKLAKENENLKKENDRIKHEKDDFSKVLIDYENKIKERNAQLEQLELRIKQSYEPMIETNKQQIQELEDHLNRAKSKIKGLTYFSGHCPYCKAELTWNRPIHLVSFVSTHIADGYPSGATSRGTTEQVLHCSNCNRDFHADYLPKNVTEITI